MTNSIKLLKWSVSSPSTECFMCSEMTHQWNILHHSHTMSFGPGEMWHWIHILCVSKWRSELIMAHRLLRGLDEDTLHWAPPVVLVRGAHAVHFALATDWVAILLACHAQEDVCAHMFEAHSLITLPVDAVALYCPNVQVVTLTIFTKSADLLQTTDGGGKEMWWLWLTDQQGVPVVKNLFDLFNLFDPFAVVI